MCLPRAPRPTAAIRAFAAGRPWRPVAAGPNAVVAGYMNT